MLVSGTGLEGNPAAIDRRPAAVHSCCRKPDSARMKISLSWRTWPLQIIWFGALAGEFALGWPGIAGTKGSGLWKRRRSGNCATVCKGRCLNPEDICSAALVRGRIDLISIKLIA
jgi:hypothetical protein